MIAASVALAFAAPVSAAPALVFSDPSPTHSLELSKSGRFKLLLCNVGSLGTTRLNGKFVVSSFTDSGAKLGPDTPLSVTIKPAAIVPKSCAVVAVSTAAQRLPNRPQYIGEMIVTAGNSSRRLARKSVVIKVKRGAVQSVAAPGASAPTGAADPVDSVADGSGPALFRESNSVVSSSLLLQPPPLGTRMANLRTSCKKPGFAKAFNSLPDVDQLKLKTFAGFAAKCPFIGNLLMGDKFLRVYSYGDPARTSDRPIDYPILVFGKNAAGVYKGKLDVAHTPSNPADDVSVSLTISDSEWWALFALLIGTALSLVPQLWTRRCVPNYQFSDRIAALEDGYLKGDRIVNRAWNRKGHICAPPWAHPAEFNKYLSDLRLGLMRYRRSTVWFSSDSRAFKAIEASLKVAEDDVDCWTDPGALAGSMVGIAQDVAEAVIFVIVKLHQTKSPRVLDKIEPLAVPRQFKVGEAAVLVSDIKSARQLLANWMVLADRLERCDVRFDLLRTETSTSNPLLFKAGTAIARVLQGLFLVSSQEDIDRRKLAELLDEIEATLAELAIRPMTLGPDEFTTSTIAMDALGYETLIPPSAGLRQITDRIEQKPTRPAIAAEIEPRLWRYVATIGAVALTAAIAIGAGYVAIYQAPPFGTTMDYLKIMLAGTGVQLVSQGVINAISMALPQFKDPVTEKPIAAALPATS